jgi:hypothetical protein
MRKEHYFILIVLTCISCMNRNQLELEFENHLPETDLILLEKIVNSYDNLIKTEYNGKINDFFNQIKLDKPLLNDLNNQEYCELIKMFDKSNLEYKSQKVQYDTVYLSDQGNIISIMQPEDISEDDLVLDEDFLILPPDRTIEDEIEKIKERGYWRFISESSFTSALSKISNRNIEIQEYINAKEAIGYINPQRMASSLAKHEIDVENYFIKRIIAIELFINQIRKEYGCQQ